MATQQPITGDPGIDERLRELVTLGNRLGALVDVLPQAVGVAARSARANGSQLASAREDLQEERKVTAALRSRVATLEHDLQTETERADSLAGDLVELKRTYHIND